MTRQPQDEEKAGPLNRRALLALGATGVAAAAAACAPAPPTAPECEGQTAGGAAQAAGARTLRMVTTWPPDFPGLGSMATRTADAIGRLSSGRLTVKVFAANEIVPAFEAFDAVATGAADMYHGAEYYWQGKNPAFSFFTAVPMGLTATEIMAWLRFGGGQELWEEVSRPFGVIAFPAGNTGHQMGGWFKREINTLDDLKGLKIRIPGLGGDVVRALGAAAVAMPGSEIYPSLQSGAIDATEWVGPWNDLALGFYQVAPFYYGPGFHEPGSMLACGINLEVWESLSAEDQAVVRAACDQATAISLAEYAHHNAQALVTLRQEHGVELRTFSDEIWARFNEVSADVLASVAARDPLAQRVYDSYQAARGQLIDWGGVSEAPYMRLRGARAAE